jgi:hypothetical protein
MLGQFFGVVMCSLCQSVATALAALMDSFGDAQRIDPVRVVVSEN